MKVRLKFTKEGPVKFVGHLDTMRLFQRAIKVAGIPVAYSQGFSPHSLVYFAMPLGVGVSSRGEYMDIVTSEDVSPEAMKTSLNAVLVQGIKIIDAFAVEEKGISLMSLVTGATYRIDLEKTEDITKALVEKGLEKTELIVLKKGKKGIKPVDIKPLLLEVEVDENDAQVQLFVTVKAGSEANLNPDLLIKAIVGELPYEIAITREELYTGEVEALIPLNAFGRL